MEGIVIRRESLARLQEMILVTLVEGARDMNGKVPFIAGSMIDDKSEAAALAAIAAVSPYPFIGVNDQVPGYPMATEYEGGR